MINREIFDSRFTVKKILYVLFLFVLLIHFGGCKEPNEKIGDNDEPKIEEKEDPVIGSLYINYHLYIGVEDVLQKIDSLDEFVFLEPQRDGYIFEGWFKDEDCMVELTKSDLKLPNDENSIIVEAYSEWSIERYKVKFFSDGEEILERIVTYGVSARAPKDPFKSGFVFTGWDKDFSYVTSNLEVNAVFEKNDESQNVMVILGNWMNNDGTISQTMRARLELALKLYSEFKFSYIVVTGGMANSQAGISEAEAMYNYLVSHDIPSNKIIKEDQSMSTQQNATYTMKKLEDIDFKNLIIVSTIEHFVNYQTIKFFNDAALNNSKIKSKNINIMIFTNNGNY